MIAVGGENLIDLVNSADSNGLPTYVAHPGGSPFNVAVAIGRQEIAVTYLTPISTDRLGDLLAKRLTESGVTLGAARVDHPTSLAVVSLRNGIPSYGFYREGTAERQVNMAGLEATLFPETRIFHVGSLGLTDGDDADVWESLFLSCKTAGVVTALDPNVRPSLIADPTSYRARIRRMMAKADILKLSDEDACWLYESADFARARDACLNDSGASLTVFTRGAEGAEGYIAGQSIPISAPPVAKLADTVGAGDTFMGTLLAGMIRDGLDRQDSLAAADLAIVASCLDQAAKAAAINCTRHGCQPPTLAELAAT